jgi:branched-chain amino acid transport system substrate-binding protein
MTTSSTSTLSRRAFIGASAAATAMSLLPVRPASAAKPPVKIGILLPYSGTYAMLGEAITNGLKLRFAEAGDSLAGRPIRYIAIDSEASPPEAAQNTHKLVTRDNIDFLVGPVHSGVALAMSKIVAARGRPITIIPNAGANAITRQWCARNIFRSSFSNWQSGYPCGRVMIEDGHRTLVTMTWRYAAGEEMMSASVEDFEASGGTVLKHIRVPFPDVAFQAQLSEIAALRPDAVCAFFSGGGAVKFVTDYAATGLKARIPLYGPGFLTEGVAKAQGSAAEGIKTTLHYADTLPLPANIRFRASYRNAYGREADVFAVQGYDTASLIIGAIEAVDGDTGAIEEMAAALGSAELQTSPRGAWRMSAAHNPIQAIYLRRVNGGEHEILRTVTEALEDPATGCSLT